MFSEKSSYILNESVHFVSNWLFRGSWSKVLVCKMPRISSVYILVYFPVYCVTRIQQQMVTYFIHFLSKAIYSQSYFGFSFLLSYINLFNIFKSFLTCWCRYMKRKARLFIKVNILWFHILCYFVIAYQKLRNIIWKFPDYHERN